MKKIIMVTILAITSTFTMAADTDLYLGIDRYTTDKPNVVFILDTSTSMDSAAKISLIPLKWEQRMDVLKKAMKESIDELEGINVALMRYNQFRNTASCRASTALGTADGSCYNGGYFLTKMLDVDVPGNKDILKAAVDTLNTQKAIDPATYFNIDLFKARTIINYTPMVETVYEAKRFFNGENVVDGKYEEFYYKLIGGWQSQGQVIASADETYTGNYNNAKYISPITSQCQKNHIVLFTDGASTYDAGVDSLIRSDLAALGSYPSGLSTTCTTKNDGLELNLFHRSCLPELAHTLYAGDHSPLPGTQRISFHTIAGFLLSLPSARNILKQAAFYGDGFYSQPDNYDELKEAITGTFGSIIKTSGSFATPTVAVNAFNSLEQLDEMYYSVFKPSENSMWEGNVKRYRITPDGIYDVNGNPAINPTTGFFTKDSTSYWTPTADGPDGDEAGAGGVASRLTENRKVYTNLFGGEITHNDNRLRKSNSKLKKSDFGAEGYDSDMFNEFLDWLDGKDYHPETGDRIALRAIGDPLHSQPVLLNYGVLGSGESRTIDSVLFVGTNAGAIHAFDTNVDNPQERFTFYPKETLKVVKRYFDRTPSKEWGIDGPLSTYHKDNNKDMIINGSDKAYLYAGMRRGGRTYYALDVTNRDKPTLKWQIDNTKSGFSRLGQTWSKMIPIDIKWGGSVKKALVFGGGYDPEADSNKGRFDHSMGNAIYIVDAESGELLWRASDESSADTILPIKRSIANNIVPVDRDGNGYIDLLYAVDLGGEFWRIEINEENSGASSFAKGFRVANMGDGNPTIRIFASPDVSLDSRIPYREGGNIKYDNKIVVGVGSGDREDPLDRGKSNQYYGIFDYDVYTDRTSSITITPNELQSYSASTTSAFNATNKLKNGFIINLPGSGEKVLSRSVTLNGVVYFPTFLPATTSMNDNCEPNLGESKLYTVSFSGKRILNKKIATPGIPSDPAIVFLNPTESNPKGEIGILISTELIKPDSNEMPESVKRVYWKEVGGEPVIYDIP